MLHSPTPTTLTVALCGCQQDKQHEAELAVTRHTRPLSASWRDGRDRIVVSTSRCGRENPGSNPGHGREL